MKMNSEEELYLDLVATQARLIREAKAEVLREVAKELATLQYVRPGELGRKEYEMMLAIRRGNTDVWLKDRADQIEQGG